MPARGDPRRARGGQADAERHSGIELAGEVWEGIERCEAHGLPYPIESIADCARVTAADPRFERMLELGQRVAQRVAGELSDPQLQATFLDLADVRFVCR